MSKRKAADGNLEEEETRETKCPKMDDLRPASVQVWMKQTLVGSKIAPFLRTAEVNNLLQTCKLQRENLDTNPNAWSPALQINRPERVPGISLKDEPVARFYSKISPNLRFLDIDLYCMPEASVDVTGMCSHIAVAIKKPLEVLRFTSARDSGSRVDIESWHLFAHSMVFRGVTFYFRTEGDELKATSNIDLELPDYVYELDCTLDEYHRHTDVLYSNADIYSLKIDATAAGFKCKFCGASQMTTDCYGMHANVYRLGIQLGKRFDYETQGNHFRIEEIAYRMDDLQHLKIHGKTDRPSEWIQESINNIRSLHPKGKNLEIDCSGLEVVKKVEPQFMPFVLKT